MGKKEMIYDQKTIMDNHFDKRARDMIHTSFPAEITRIVNSAVVDVKPLIATLRPDGKAFAYCELFDVRIHTYAAQGGDVFVSLPFKVGDRVWVFVSERDTYPLMAFDRVEASSQATHDLSDCFCIPMYFTNSNIPQYSNEHLVIGNKTTRITVKEDGIVIDTTQYEVNAEQATFNCRIEMNGDVTVNANVAMEGDVKNKGVDIGKDHKHILVKAGTDDSGIVKV